MDVSINNNHNNNNNNNGNENKYELFERWLNENHSEFSMVSFFSLCCISIIRIRRIPTSQL